MILHKHETLRKEWEDVLDINLGEAEVWSRPLKNEEVYNYKEYAKKNNLDPEKEAW